MGAFLPLLLLGVAPATVETLLTAHGWGTPVHDAGLDGAAALLAQRFAGPAEGPLPEAAADTLRFVLATRQVTDAHVEPFTMRHRRSEDFLERLPALLGRLDRRLPPTHYGLSTHGHGGSLTTTLLLVHRGVELTAPLPRWAEPGSQLPVQGALRRGYFRPRAFIAPPQGGRIRDRPAWTQERAVDVTLYFDSGPGIYGVELVAESQYGPVVLHNAEIHVGVAVPELPVTRLPAPPSGDPPDVTLLRLVNQQRAAHGAPPLRAWPDLAQVAQAYAAELAERRTLLHGSPDTGTLETRLRAKGLRFTQAAENLAEAATAREALTAFLASPGHKRNLLHRGLTHVGIGVVGRYFVVALVTL